ncbi:Thioesterase/thiol ester dehydrase-isomerase [Glarea lozoyensis ATCC 20868]|uniref:Thioesterase/thiol ester dehydrase-isomerase n=1 Tax=Glarea lozoyensis (strain ATCC 20868 / MF5171) TaxID=1116229 RepID=S3DLA3_GLAL2|nr:Thioesterase/thiol ester dehydrase-isomerase [Glarea lozoyensis ATCC 20868]EPE27328.1 Thioesterase/thiol ester dehydrase-isomerase [Glarea lozoyensis ATCC 20868]
MSGLHTLPRLTRSVKCRPQLSIRQARPFSACSRCQTDGVYQELTAMRTRMPFIEALRAQQDNKDASNKPATPNPASRDLTPKSMEDSYVKVILPLARDPWLLDRYISASGHIRLGTLFMDLDALAGVVAYKHTGDAVMTVTAAVDRITLQRPLKEICDLELSGRVTFATGRSSMEVSLQVAKAPAEGQAAQEDDILMTCAFTMVSLDPTTKKSVPISPLNPTTPEEKKLFDQGQKNYNLKKAASKLALRKQTPNDEESDLIHALWLQQLGWHDPNTQHRKPDNALSMAKTQIQSVQIMQPQYRNRHNFMIFGGFLLKSTFELAFTCVASMSHTRPTFIALDPSTFENPVPVGSVLYLTATVAYTDSPLLDEGVVGSETGRALRDRKVSAEGMTRVQVRVDSKVKSVEHDGETKGTGVFNYTFEVKKDIKVVPETYAQMMMFLDARRRCIHLDNKSDVAGEGEQAQEGLMT